MIGQNKEQYIPEKYRDLRNENGEYVEGVWRSYNPDTILAHLECPMSGRPHEDAKGCRNSLKKFVNSVYGSVDWQERATYQEPN